MAQRDDVLRFMLNAERFAQNGYSIRDLHDGTGISLQSLRVLMSCLAADKLVSRKARNCYVLSDQGRLSATNGHLSPMDMLVLEYCVLYGPQRILDVYCRDQQTNPQVVAPSLNRLERRGLIEKVGNDLWRATPAGEELHQQNTKLTTPEWEQQYYKDVDAWDQREREVTEGLIDELGWRGRTTADLTEAERDQFLAALNRRLALLGPRPDWDTYRENADG